MTLRVYLLVMTIATIIFWLALGLIVVNTDPTTAAPTELGLFYTVLVFAVTGTGAILGFLVRFLALKQEMLTHSVVIAFRQALLGAVLVVGVLFLFSQQLFSWLNLGLLLLSLSALEFFLLSYHKE